MPLYKDQGIVLRTHKLGEADRVVVFITRGRGKVRAVAKGVRKTKSRLGGRLEPPTHVSLLLHEGRDLDVVSQADTLDSFRPLHEDLGALTDAVALLEAVDQVAQQGEPNEVVYTMLLGALRTLAAGRSPLLVPAFYWKLLAAEGVAPLLDRCVRCGEDRPEGLAALDLADGGALCVGCRPAGSLAPGAITLVRRILGGELRAVLVEPPGPAAAAVAALATTALEMHLERRLRAARVLDRA